MTITVSLGEAGKEPGVSGGDPKRPGVRRVSREQLDGWARQPPGWLVKRQQRKAGNARRPATAKVEVSCSICGVAVLRMRQTARNAAAYVLVCSSWRTAGKKPALLAPEGVVWAMSFDVAGGFVGCSVLAPPAPGSGDELAEAWPRAWKDQGGTGTWASSVLHRASVHEIDLGDGRVVPVLPPALEALH